MDPAAMMNEGSFANGNANTPSYNLAEIWQFPMNGGAGLGESGGGLGLRRPQFGHNLGQFGDFTSGSIRDVSGNDPISSEQRANGVNRKRRDSEDESAKGVSTGNGGTDNGNGVNDGDGKRLRTSVNRNQSSDTKVEAELSSGKPAEQSTQPAPEPPKPDYIHVRARRGQATDSHSLAERARREKISERMKILQDLVPGCNKVIGKALVLDEIINYIQSLQRQVEFLSMKIEAVNTQMDPGIEVFPPKDFGQQTFDTAGMAFGPQATREFSRGSSPEWLHMQVSSSHKGKNIKGEIQVARPMLKSGNALQEMFHTVLPMSSQYIPPSSASGSDGQHNQHARGFQATINRILKKGGLQKDVKKKKPWK